MSNTRRRHRPRVLDGALGAQRVDGEVVLGIHKGRGIRPSGAGGVAAEQVDGVLVAVLGVDGFAATELERLAAHPNLLARQADEMHLDAALSLIVAGAMAE